MRLPPPRRLYDTASATGCGRRATYVSQTAVKAASIAARSCADDHSARSTTKVGELKGAVSALDEPLNLGLGLRQLACREAHAFHTLLEQGQSATELQLVAFELGDDRLQPEQRILELHDTNVCGSPASTEAVRAFTRPSRRSSSNSPPGSNRLAEVSALPPGSRATA